MSLNNLKDHVREYLAHALWPSRSVAEDIALMHSELSEALEEHRNGRAPNETYYFLHGHPAWPDGLHTNEDPRHEGDTRGKLKPEGIPSELADVILRIVHFAINYDIDLDEAVSTKLAYNVTRGARHGGKKL